MKEKRVQDETIEYLSLSELCRFCDADEAWIVELVEYGVLTPVGRQMSNWRFVGANILRAKKARRLNRDLGINAPGVALVLKLLEEREAVVNRLTPDARKPAVRD